MSIPLNFWIRPYTYNVFLINAIRAKYRKNKRLANLILLVCLPYITVNWLLSELLAVIRTPFLRRIGGGTDEFRYKMAIACISKNEGPYLKEWIEYHKMLGVDCIFFYDNESSDDTKGILSSYIASGYVEYHEIKGVGKQLAAYNDALKKHRNDTKYIAFIDMDEYIMPTNDGETILQVVDRLMEKYPWVGGVALNWCCYGSSGHKKRPHGLITENYVHVAKPCHFMNAHVKTICNPRVVNRSVSPHFVKYKIGYFAINETDYSKQWGWYADPREYKNIRINHYLVKSEEDFMIKKGRGLGDREGSIDMTYFYNHDFKEAVDVNMRRYAARLHERVES